MPKTRWTLAAAASATLIAAAILWGGGRDPSDPRQPGKLRIVSLAPSATEILFVLGVGDCVVGATTHCDYPPQAREIERVGGFGMPNVEKLLALAPDLIVAAGLERTDAVAVLRESGIAMIDVQARNFEELFDAIRRTGQSVKRSPQAEDLVAHMRAELQAVAEQRAAAKDRPPPRVFVEIWDRPLMTAGGGSFLDDLIARAGGSNVAHDLPQPHPRINAEKVIEWNPDVILVARMGHEGKAAERLSRRIGWAGISAVANKHIIDDIPCDLLLRPGPRLIDGVKALAARLGRVESRELRVGS